MIRHLISRSTQLVILFVLLLTLATAVLTTTQLGQRLAAAMEAPVAIQVADGWGDPTGG